ncbi:MAG: hypothetical protein K0V04_15005, partial [Deltaproteobacteria bacterium]|nr:hypothetical protein [Deltaproteobacteria bacterium]
LRTAAKHDRSGQQSGASSHPGSIPTRYDDQRMLAAVALALGLAGPSAPPAVATLPLEVDGQLDDQTRQAWSEQLVDGLVRSEFDVKPSPTDVAAPCDDACRDALREAADVEHLVQAHVSVDDRVYRIRVELIDANGEVLLRTEDGCEVCGRSDVGALMASQGGALRRQWALRNPAVEPPPAITAPRLPPTPPADQTTPPRRDARRPAGAVLVSAGAGAAAVGITLLVLHGRPYRARCTDDDVDFRGQCRLLHDTALGGGLTLASGVALVATGVVLLVRARQARRATARRRHQRWASVAPHH